MFGGCLALFDHVSQTSVSKPRENKLVPWDGCEFCWDALGPPKCSKSLRKKVGVAIAPACYRSLLGPKWSGSVPRGVPRGVSGALRTPGSGVSKKCPESVPGVSKGVRTPRGHSRDTFWTLRGPKGPRDTPRNTPRDTPGALRARRARETPVAGWGDCKVGPHFQPPSLAEIVCQSWSMCSWCCWMLQSFAHDGLKHPSSQPSLCQTYESLRVLSATFILSKNSRVLDAESRLKSASLS